MSSRRQRNRAIKRDRHKINPESLTPKLASGLTQGKHALAEAAEIPRDKPRDGVKALQHMNSETSSGTARVPRPHFVGANRVTDLVRQYGDERRFADVELTFTGEVLQAMREGMVCLRCLEPQPYGWADVHIQGCEGVELHGPHYMRECQTTDIVLEFEGVTHLGPSKPIAEVQAELEDRAAQGRFDAKIEAGASRMKGLRNG